MAGAYSKGVIGIVVVLLLLVTCTFLLLYMNIDSCTCFLSAKKPQYHPNSTYNIASSTDKSLANFAGYVEYNKFQDDKVFMPLVLKSVAERRTERDSVLELTADCATISLFMSLNITDNRIRTDSVQVNLVLPNGQDSFCSVSELDISFNPKRTHYSCNRERYYCCKKAVQVKDGVIIYKDIARLTILRLEFEVDGDSDFIRHKEFSTKAEICR